jgi:hypothetical protein
MRSSGEGKSGAGGLTRFLKGKGEGERKQWPGYWPSMAEGRRRLIAFKRGRAIDGGGVTEGEVKEGRGGRCSTRHKEED